MKKKSPLYRHTKPMFAFYHGLARALTHQDRGHLDDVPLTPKMRHVALTIFDEMQAHTWTHAQCLDHLSMLLNRCSWQEFHHHFLKSYQVFQACKKSWDESINPDFKPSPPDCDIQEHLGNVSTFFKDTKTHQIKSHIATQKLLNHNGPISHKNVTEIVALEKQVRHMLSHRRFNFLNLHNYIEENLFASFLGDVFLQHCSFDYANMAGVYLDGLLAQDCSFKGIECRNYPYSLNVNQSSIDEKQTSSHLGEAVCINCDFSGADLSDAYMRHGYFYNCTFHRTILVNANLFEANLENCDFSEAILVNADLGFANVAGASFEGADMRNTRMPKNHTV